MTVQAEPVAETQQERAPLTAHDRCDACGAQAYYEAELYDLEGKKGRLLFCGHHFTMHERELHDVALEVHDHSHQLLP